MPYALFRFACAFAGFFAAGFGAVFRFARLACSASLRGLHRVRVRAVDGIDRGERDEVRDVDPAGRFGEELLQLLRLDLDIFSLRQLVALMT